MKFSVIIPAYNAEKTIQDCLDSLLDQPHEGVELIVVNDGSQDSTGDICREYADRNTCIRYIEKENGGVSSARNMGLDMARGEYILFVDSDDYVAPDYFDTVDQTVKQHNPDLMLFGIRLVGTEPQVWNTGDYATSGKVDTARKIRKAVRAYLFSNLLSKVFRRDIIQKHSIRFVEQMQIAEDQAFVLSYAVHVEELVSVSKEIYIHTVGNPESLSRKKREYLADQLLLGSLAMLEALDCGELTEDARNIYMECVVWAHYRSAYSASKELRKFDLPAGVRRVKIKEICDKFTLRQLQPRGFGCWIIALPIRWKMSSVVDLMAGYQYHRRQCSIG